MKHLKVRVVFLIPIFLILMIGYIGAAISEEIDVHYVYKVCPSFFIYTDLDNGSAGVAKGIFVWMDHSSRDDKSVINHELIHVKQAYRTLFQNWMSYFSEKWSADLEAEAYVIDIKDKRSFDIWAGLIQDEYAPSVPLEYIKERLDYHWGKLHNL